MGADKRRNAGDVLRRCRLESELTQRDVADFVRQVGNVGLCETHYRRIEKGLMTPSVVLAMDIASAVDADVYEIWG